MHCTKPIITAPYSIATAHSRPRRGFVLVMVLVALAVTMAFFLAATRSMLVVRKTINLQSRQNQADCLAASGLRRAAAKLAGDKNYAGETWKLSPVEMGGRDGANVFIKVQEGSGNDERVVHVDADYPDDPFDRAHVSREDKISLTKGTKK